MNLLYTLTSSDERHKFIPEGAGRRSGSVPDSAQFAVENKVTRFVARINWPQRVVRHRFSIETKTIVFASGLSQGRRHLIGSRARTQKKSGDTFSFLKNLIRLDAIFIIISFVSRLSPTQGEGSEYVY